MVTPTPLLLRGTPTQVRAFLDSLHLQAVHLESRGDQIAAYTKEYPNV